MLGARNKNVEGEPYEWIHYDEVINRSIDLAHAFQALGIATGQQTCIGLYSQNRPEWVIVEHAAYTFNNVLVPFYETLGSDACIFIM
jgi:long-chain acyl-CoA synthetase